jgi:6,7-dimethyl-8-ribityllumazine synthase
MSGRAPKSRPTWASPKNEPKRSGADLPRGARFAVIASRFHEAISGKLADGALSTLSAHGVPPGRVDLIWVPGSFELPQAARALARSGRYAALVCIGVVIRGETPHFEHVAREAAAGIRDVALTTGVPVSFGVITALTEAQAWERAGGAVGNRGEEAAAAAVEMAALIHHYRETARPSRRRLGRASASA